MNCMFLKTCILILSGTIYAYFLQPQSALSQVQGTVRNHKGVGLVNVRITVAKKFTTCSYPAGWYTLVLTPDSGISITYRKKGYKKTPFIMSHYIKDIPDIYLEECTAQRELWGKVGVEKEGIAVKLYRKTGGGYQLIDTAVTCADGIYAFSELADDFYKIVPECSVCVFSPKSHEGSIPSLQQYDFIAHCSPGECQ